MTTPTVAYSLPALRARAPEQPPGYLADFLAAATENTGETLLLPVASAVALHTKYGGLRAGQQLETLLLARALGHATDGCCSALALISAFSF